MKLVLVAVGARMPAWADAAFADTPSACRPSSASS